MDKNLEERIAKLEKEMSVYRKAIVITPTKILIKQSVLINGIMNADRVYTKRSGSHVELTT